MNKKKKPVWFFTAMPFLDKISAQIPSSSVIRPTADARSGEKCLVQFSQAPTYLRFHANSATCRS